jgi:hypothetical protein
MSRVLPRPFAIMFIFIEPILTIAGAYSCFSSPEWYLASLIPGPTVSGLLHTNETAMAVRLYGVLLLLLAMISLAVFPVIYSRSDAVSFSVARRLMFVLAGLLLICLADLAADVLHVYVAAMHLGEKRVKDVANWNDMTWGNIGITAGLFASRIAWFVFVGARKVKDTEVVSPNTKKVS